MAKKHTYPYRSVQGLQTMRGRADKAGNTLISELITEILWLRREVKAKGRTVGIEIIR